MTQKLIILRGPSGSGKSTVAKALLKNATRKTCLIEQDYYRYIFRPRDEGSKANSTTIHKTIKENVLTALNDGYDVILEGIFTTESYRHDINEILNHHTDENYLFYFDISLEETIRRQQTRPSRNTQTYVESDLRTFYPESYIPIHDSEKTIQETSTENQTLEYIIATSNL